MVLLFLTCLSEIGSTKKKPVSWALSKVTRGDGI